MARHGLRFAVRGCLKSEVRDRMTANCKLGTENAGCAGRIKYRVPVSPGKQTQLQDDIVPCLPHHPVPRLDLVVRREDKDSVVCAVGAPFEHGYRRFVNLEDTGVTPQGHIGAVLEAFP